MNMGAFNRGRILPGTPEQPVEDGADSAVAPVVEESETAADETGDSPPVAEPEGHPSPLPAFDLPAEEVFTLPQAAKRRALGEMLAAAALVLLGIGWIVLVGFALSEWGSGPIGPLLRITTWIGVGSAPLALLAILWLVLAQGSRSHSRRYGRTARAMRADSENLVAVLGIVTQRLDESRDMIAAQAAMLDQLGQGAASRIAAASDAIRHESGEYQRLTALIEESGSAARHDIRALIDQLPSADDHAQRIAATLRLAGTTTQEQIDTLARQLGAVAEASHAADLQVNSSADRLTMQLGHLASTGAQTVRRIEEVSQGLDRTIGQSLETAGQAIDATRQGVTEQARALSALAEQARAALERAGADQAAVLGRRLEDITTRIDGFVSRLAGQDAGSLELVSNLELAIDRIDARFAALGATSAEQTSALGETLAALVGHVDQVVHALGGGTVAAGTLLDRVSTVRQVLDSNARDLEDTIPASLSRLRLHAERSLASVNAATPQAEALAAITEATALRIAEVTNSVEAQGKAVESLGTGVDRRLSAVRDQAVALNRLIGETSQGAEALAAGTTNRLIEAMARVRDSASAASEVARTALAALLPAVAADIGAAIETTVDRVLAEKTRAHIEGIAAAADEAMSAADRAAEFLRQHVVGIDLAAQSMEGRVIEAGKTSADEIAARIAAVERAAETMEQRLVAAGQASTHQIGDRLAEIGRATEEMEVQLQAAGALSSQQIAERVATVDQAAASLEDRMREASRISLEHISTRVAAVAKAAEAMEHKVSDAGDATAERLTGQIAEVTRAAEAMEARVNEAREATDKTNEQLFSRQVALLVESLNSSAIDVAKILSNDITDTAWAAYLRGDRGVFTRRAVRLLDNSDTREILKIYSAEPEFREQVNRYIHDFEAMLRRVLSSRDGGPLGVTILSSDMGKLYVALAQAIERLRS